MQKGMVAMVTNDFWFDKAGVGDSMGFVQHQFFRSCLGWVLPAQIATAGLRLGLDVGCGLGGWMFDASECYPQMRLVGIDIDQHLLNEATQIARLRGVSNLSFKRMDALSPLDFKESTFDIVYACSSALFVGRAQWPAYIAELVRVLRPGGWLLLIEFEWGHDFSSEAFSRLRELLMRSVCEMQRSLSPEGLYFGAAAHIYGYLMKAGLADVQYEIHAVDCGVDNRRGARAYIEDVLSLLLRSREVICEQQQLIDVQSYNDLLARARHEMLEQSASCGYSYLVAAMGCKAG